MVARGCRKQVTAKPKKVRSSFRRRKRPLQKLHSLWRGSMPVQCACVNLTIARVRMILKREFGWTTQGSRILLLPDDLNTGPGTGHVVTISAAGSHRYSHRRLNSLHAPSRQFVEDR